MYRRESIRHNNKYKDEEYFYHHNPQLPITHNDHKSKAIQLHWIVSWPLFAIIILRWDFDLTLLYHDMKGSHKYQSLVMVDHDDKMNGIKKGNASYHSIPDVAKDNITDDESSSKQSIANLICCKKHRSFLSGVILGVFLACAHTLYEGARLSVAVMRSSSTYHPRANNPTLHTINTLLHLHPQNKTVVSIGPRPYFLINEMDDSNPELKSTLQKCAKDITTFRRSNFVLGHRGAALQFPEHTDRGHDASLRMGAAVVECDINLTKDKQLICRHERCDLHLTTNVLMTPLASKCTQQFRPASGNRPATAKCCTTDFTLNEIQNQMCGKMVSRCPIFVLYSTLHSIKVLRL